MQDRTSARLGLIKIMKASLAKLKITDEHCQPLWATCMSSVLSIEAGTRRFSMDLVCIFVTEFHTLSVTEYIDRLPGILSAWPVRMRFHRPTNCISSFRQSHLNSPCINYIWTHGKESTAGACFVNHIWTLGKEFLGPNLNISTVISKMNFLISSIWTFQLLYAKKNSLNKQWFTLILYLLRREND